MKIQRRLLVSLNSAERKEIRNITVQGEYGMRNLLGEVYRNPEKYHTAEIYLCRDKGRLIGWSALAPKEYTGSGRTELWVYVRREYRRIGLGSKLYKLAKRRLNRLRKRNTVSPWNDAGYKFFKAQGVRNW